MKRILYGLDADPGTPVIAAVPNSTDLGPQIASLVGDGNPYWIWSDPDLPTEIMTADEIGADFNEAPLASDDWQTNRIRANAVLADPPATGEGGKVWAVA